MIKNNQKALYFLCTVILLDGCAVGPDFVEQTAPKDAAYSNKPVTQKTVAVENISQSFYSGSIKNEHWWTMFNQSSLNQIVEEAIQQNFSLQASEAALRQSQDLLRAGYGVFFPQVSAGINASRNLTAPMQLGSTASGSIFNLLTAGASVSYTIDIFGGERRQVEALRAQMNYQKYSTVAAYLILTSNVVNTSIARAAYLEEIKVTEELIALEKEQLKVANAQVIGGTAAYATVLSIQSLIASNEASIAPLRQKVSQTEHLLAALEGEDPGHVELANFSLKDLTLPQDIPITLPAELVRQRPDILAAEEALHVTSANIGVATANMLPSITINAGYGVSSNPFSSLSAQSQRFWTIGPSVDIPIFKGGELYFTRKAAIDAYQQALANYRQTVLTAFTQVADCLSALEHDAEALRGQYDAMNAAEVELKLQQISYDAGLLDYLSVLVADVQYHQASIAYLQALAQRYQDTVALYIALGGGWSESNISQFDVR